MAKTYRYTDNQEQQSKQQAKRTKLSKQQQGRSNNRTEKEFWLKQGAL